MAEAPLIRSLVCYNSVSRPIHNEKLGYDGRPSHWHREPFTERLMPGCFAGYLRGCPDIRALVQHDDSKCLGSTWLGSLQLVDAGDGLRWSLQLGNDALARETVDRIRAGSLVGSSFRFNVVRCEWVDERYSGWIRQVHEASISEVSLCEYPAYRRNELHLIYPSVDMKRKLLELAKKE